MRPVPSGAGLFFCPLTADTPWVSLETSRLCLRRWRTRDIPWLREMLVAERGVVMSWLAAYWQVRVDRCCWALVEKSTGAGVGWIAVDDGWVGYALRPAWRNQGLMTEALRAVAAAHGRLGARVDPANPASRRVLEKCGFRTVGEEGGFLVYGLLS